MTRSTPCKRLMLAALEDRLAPAVYVVNSLTDFGAGTGLTGDLRYCIAKANMNPGADSIDATGVAGTILLNGQLPTISDDLVIDGLGAKILTIDGNLATRLLQIAGPTTPIVEFNNLKFTNGGTNSNGGIALVDSAKVSFTNCVLNNSFSNQGGALFGSSASSLLVADCTLSGNSGFVGAGAIYSTGTLTVRNSTLSGNTTGPFGSGGAIGISGNAVSLISNSTLSGNTASINGGAIRVLFSFAGTLNIWNTTITLNNVSDSVGTGRGISQAGSAGKITIESTIVAQNSGGAAGTSDVTGAVTAHYSLFGTTDAATITGTGNFKGTNSASIDAKLGPLADNGGLTKTHMPMDDSPVREAGYTPDFLTEDQRGVGFARTENYATDIGAVEMLNYRPMAANIDVYVTESSPATTFRFNVTYYDPRGSQLVDYSSLGTGDIYIPGPNGYYEIPTFISATPTVDAPTSVATYEIPVPVNGKAGWDLTDNGIYALIVLPNEIFDKDAPTPNVSDTVAFAFLIVDIPVVYTVDEVSDVDDGDYGPGKFSLREAILKANTDGVSSKIDFDPVVFSSAKTISLTGGDMKIEASVSIVGPDAPLTLDASTNTGRIFTIDPAPAKAAVNISGMTMQNANVTGEDGAAILNIDANLSLTEVSILNNTTDEDGGGISVYSALGSLNLMDCVISNNKATGMKSNGGGIDVFEASDVTMLRCTVSGNEAGEDGGGIYFRINGSLNMDECTVSGNTANKVGPSPDPQQGGGGIYLFYTVAEIRNSTISNNAAKHGGGILIYGNTDQTKIFNSTIAHNSATDIGGGISALGTSPGVYRATLDSVIVANNAAPTDSDIAGYVYADYSLIGNDNGATISGGNNLINVNPLIGPLANNGGPTQTHALLAGSPALNVGRNSSGLLTDQRGAGFDRVVGSAADIGAFEEQTTVTPAKVTSVQVNDGSVQRSRVTSLTITFDNPPTLPANPEDAFQLVRQSPSGAVALDAMVSTNSVTLTFVGGPLDFGSLADGRYTLTIHASQLTNLDGNGDGTTGDDYQVVGDPAMTPKLFRLFGDADGNGTVTSTDFAVFRTFFGLGTSVFDFNNDGQTNSNDFAEFRKRFGITLP